MSDDRPEYPFDVDTLARWLIIQAGGVREARNIVTRNRDAARSRHVPKVAPHVVIALALQIQKTKPSYRGGQIAMYTAIELAARRLFKNANRRDPDVRTAVQAARRFFKNGYWSIATDS